MALHAGTRLGPYEILAPLGRGGMGEVYRGRDARLSRDVAIKVLPAGLLSDAERLARFEREARVLASMNHPGIAAIHGIEEADHTPALIMELVEGPTLAERVAQGALPADEAIDVARQLADAIEYAHDRGIVHRDLKPANVKLRPDGVVKVLDFGLARALDQGPGEASGELSQSPTLTQRMTQAGVILGTAAYMAPEQARGREADRRADIWAFGVLLYEMVTGRRAFAGDTISETLASVMRDEPDWSALPPDLSPRWAALIRRCLVKDPKRRLQAMGEARIALEDIANRTASEVGILGSIAAATADRTETKRGPLFVPWFIAAIAVLGLLLTVWRKPPQPTIREVNVAPPAGERFDDDNGYHFFALSPDARTLAYTVRNEGRPVLHLRRLDTRGDVEVPDAESARGMFFSPDGEWVAFFDSRRLRKVSVRGGSPETIANAGQDRLGTWLEDGTIVFSRETTEPLLRVPEGGGTPVAVTQLDTLRRERTHRFPCALDGGPWVVFTVGVTGSPGDYDDASIDAVNVKTGERRHLLTGARRAVWAPPGSLVFARKNDLYAVPIDPRNPRITRKPLPVLEGVGGDASSGASYVSIADDGTLAWSPATWQQNVREIGWFDRAGRWTPTTVPSGEYRRATLSPDGTRALLMVGPGGGSGDLWLADLVRGVMRRVTHGGQGGSAVWLPDQASIVYSRSDSGGGELVIHRRLDGSGERQLYRSRWPQQVSDVARGGRAVLAGDYGFREGRIREIPVDAPGPPRVIELPGETGSEQAGVLSPDGKWLAFITNKTRREEVCIRRFDGSGGNWQLSMIGGGGVRWGRPGELFYVSREEMLVRVPIDLRGEEPVIGQSENLFEVPATPTEATFRDYSYDPVSDRFLFTRPVNEAAQRREIALSIGWSRRLGAQLRAKGQPRP